MKRSVNEKQPLNKYKVKINNHKTERKQYGKLKKGKIQARYLQDDSEIRRKTRTSKTTKKKRLNNDANNERLKAGFH